MNDLSQFKLKYVQGLYTFTHYERADGAFVQVNPRGDTVVFRDTEGTMTKYSSVAKLKEAWNKCSTA